MNEWGIMLNERPKSYPQEGWESVADPGENLTGALNSKFGRGGQS